MKYRNSSYQTLDEIVWKHYGYSSGPLEKVLEANPGIADYGPFLPTGLYIELPRYQALKTKKGIRLWD